MGLIYLDSCLLIYAVEHSGDLGVRTRAALRNRPDDRFAVSPLVKLECLVHPIKNGELVLQKQFEDFFERLQTLLMPETVYLAAAQLRAKFGLRTPDALHLACAQEHGCSELWTNDGRLERAGFGLARNVVG